MDNISKLLSEKCPDGVQYKTVGDVCDTVTDYVAAGSFADLAKNVQYLSSPDYAMLIRTMDIKNGFSSKNPIYIDQNAYEYLWRVKLDGNESVILPNIGNCGEVYYLFESLPYERCALATNAILVRSNLVLNKYLYYTFQGADFQKKLKKIISPAGQTKFNKTDLKKITIPIPPKEIQEEIVGILDLFANLETDLKLELSKRKQQYDFYREQLLMFEDEKEVSWYTLDDVFYIRNGYTPSKKNSTFWEGGNIPWFRMEDIRQNGHILNDSI